MITKTINKQLFIYGKHVKHADFKTPIYVHENKRDSYSKSSTGEKRDDSLSRARTNLYRLIHCNIRQHGEHPPIFLTTTYRENQCDIQQANKDFANYIKRLNRHLSTKLRYISVPEYQKRGAVHHHTIFFNVPYKHYTFFQDLWGKGSTRIEKARNVKNLSAYISKYLTKDTIQATNKGQRLLLTSKHLKRPQIFHNEDVDIKLQSITIDKVLNTLTTDKKKEYEAKFIYYDSNHPTN